uniref:BSD domain-containing protein n=1 Tax=Wuchereria bancrofti TaxID=6293 RepID=A0A1I8EWK5_WUCBA
MMNITSWMQQAKEVTKKISDMMYIPPADNVESEISADAVFEKVCIGMETEEGSTGLKEVENKENISSNNGLTMKIEGGNNSNQNVGGLDRNKLESNAAATVKAAKKYASKDSFFSMAKEATTKAAITAEATAKKLQNVVAEKTIIGNLDKEQAKFKDEVNANKLAACILPWSDLPDQWVAKKHILSLSLDARNFTRDPPSETNFDFTQMQSVAAALLEDDPNLRKIRFQLVPKKYSLHSFLHENVKSSNFEDKKAEEKKLQINKGNELSKTSTKEQNETENEDSETKNKKLNEIRENIANATQEKIGEVLERDLINSLNDYELVSGQMDKTDEQWEEEITELLNSA